MSSVREALQELLTCEILQQTEGCPSLRMRFAMRAAEKALAESPSAAQAQGAPRRDDSGPYCPQCGKHLPCAEHGIDAEGFLAAQEPPAPPDAPPSAAGADPHADPAVGEESSKPPIVNRVDRSGWTPKEQFSAGHDIGLWVHRAHNVAGRVDEAAAALEAQRGEILRLQGNARVAERERDALRVEADHWELACDAACDLAAQLWAVVRAADAMRETLRISANNGGVPRSATDGYDTLRAALPKDVP